MNLNRVAEEGDCLIWQGAVSGGRYGSVGNGRGGTMLVHRAAYEVQVGPIPEGLTIDHLCRNKLCINTDHLEPVTRAENNRRAAAAKTHCKHGHPLSGENLRIKQRARGTQRECATCERARVTAHRAASRERAS